MTAPSRAMGVLLLSVFSWQARVAADTRENHIAYYPSPIGPGFIVPNTHSLFGGQFAYGTTLETDGRWKQYDAYTIYMDVDTSKAAFTSTPVYLTSLGGKDGAQHLIGTTAIYSPSQTGFRMYLRVQTKPTGEEIAIGPDRATQLGLYINWIGVFPYGDSASDMAGVSDHWDGEPTLRARALVDLGVITRDTVSEFFTQIGNPEIRYSHLTYRYPGWPSDQTKRHVEVRWASDVSQAHPPGYASNQDAIDWEWRMSYLALPRRTYTYDQASSALMLISRVVYTWHQGNSPYEIYTDLDYSHAGFVETPVIITGSETYRIGENTILNATPSSARIVIRHRDESSIYPCRYPHIKHGCRGISVPFVAIGKAPGIPPPCQDECLSDTCVDGRTFSVCSNWDSDPCLEPELITCPSRQGCENRNGSVHCFCRDECSQEGQKVCRSSSTVGRCEIDGRGCYYWSTSKCGDNERCENGRCVSCTPPDNHVLHMGSRAAQRTPYWCWAASIEEISSYLGHAIDQCEAVNSLRHPYGDKNCCWGCSGACRCSAPGYAAFSRQEIRYAWSEGGYDTTPTYVPTWDEMRRRISCRREPIQAILWSGSAGHVVTIHGYSDAYPDTIYCDAYGRCPTGFVCIIDRCVTDSRNFVLLVDPANPDIGCNGCSNKNIDNRSIIYSYLALRNDGYYGYGWDESIVDFVYQPH